MSKVEEEFEEWRYKTFPTSDRNSLFFHVAKQGYLAACAKREEEVEEAIDILKKYLKEYSDEYWPTHLVAKALAILEGGKGGE